MSAPRHTVADSSTSVSIDSFVADRLPPATETPDEILKRKFLRRALLVAILQILGLIVATIL